MSTNVLVTGGAGYIGSHACKALARAGFRPIVYDNLEYGHEEAVRWGPLVEGDLADAGRLRAVMSTERVRAVMHFAAYAYVGESMEKPADYFRNNVVNTLTLLDAMRDVGAETIVFSSTCATYGKPNAVPIAEDHQQLPVSPYGESKLMSERLIAWYGKAYGFDYANLRYFNAAGADPEGEIGEDHQPETHLIPLAIQAALGQGPALRLFGTDWPTPDGSCVRDFIHVSDLAEAHVLALRHLLDDGGSFNVNLGTGTGHSVLEVIETVERFAARPVPVVHAPRRPGDPPILVADPAKASSLIGWKPQRSDLDSIVETALAWQSRRVIPPRAAAVR